MEPDIFVQKLYSVYNPSVEIIIRTIATQVSAKFIAGIIQNISRHSFKFDTALKITDNILESTQMTRLECYMCRIWNVVSDGV
jgi:hypothetical protein